MPHRKGGCELRAECGGGAYLPVNDAEVGGRSQRPRGEASIGSVRSRGQERRRGWGRWSGAQTPAWRQGRITGVTEAAALRVGVLYVHGEASDGFK